MKHDPATIRGQILSALPPGFVIPRHNENSHWYEIDEASRKGFIRRFYEDGYTLPVKTPDEQHAKTSGIVMTNPVYPSVTAKLQVLKDEGLANFKMNRALEYIFAHFKEFNDENIMEHLGLAERVPADLFTEAGDIGTAVHDTRQAIFDEWIRTGKRPTNYPSFVPPEKEDVRVTSCLAALEKFVNDYNYRPVVCEMLVYSHQHKVAGTLDDLGLMRILMRPGRDEHGQIIECDHTNDSPTDGPQSCVIEDPNRNVERCIKCGAKWKTVLALVDLKTSNRFKDHYFFQVGMYFDMFRKLTGIKPEKLYIVKLSKEDRMYKLEEIKRPAKIASYARHVLKTNEGIDFIKEIRKDNQRVVVKL